VFSRLADEFPRMTRASHFIPIRESMDAPELACLYLDRIFCYHGFPHSIISDCGSIFVSSFLMELIKLCGTKMKPSTAYYPQTDGLTECTNQTLEGFLRMYCSYQQDDWVNYLALAEFSFNNAKNTSTQQTPFFANLGYHPTFSPIISTCSMNPAASEFATRLENIHAELRAELAHSNEYMAKYYNQHHLVAPVFEVGSLVWLMRRNIKITRPTLKFDYRRLGPFKVLDRHGLSSYLLALPASMSRLHPIFHVSLLEKYISPSVIPDHKLPSVPHLKLEVLDNSRDIETILDACKVGQRYDYFIHWHNLPISERSWIPMSDIPTTLNEQMEQFHRHNPQLPRPPRFNFKRPIIPVTSISTSTTEPPPPMPYIPLRTPTPPPGPRTHPYKPPTQTTTRSGHTAQPPASKDYTDSILKKGMMS
jgi:hypothetical protein